MHATLGHISWGKVSRILGMPVPSSPAMFCRACAATRIHKKHKTRKAPQARQSIAQHEAEKQNDKATPMAAGEYLHVDLHGKVRHPTKGGAQYFAVVVDEFSGRVFTFILKKKKHFLEHFKRLVDIIESETKNRVAKVKADGDGIFRGTAIHTWLDSKHIAFTPSTPYTSHHN